MNNSVTRFLEMMPAFVTLLIITMAACAPDRGEPGDPGTSEPALLSSLSAAVLDRTSWILESYGPAADPVKAQAGVEALLAFDNINEMHGTAGCNNFFLLYSIEGLAITTGELERTRFACGDEGIREQDVAVLAALASLESIGLEGDRLVLTYDGGVLRFFEEPPPAITPLTGTMWHLVGIREKGVDRPMWNASPLTAEFSEGFIRGDTGCNGYGGEYEIEGSVFSVVEIAQSAQGCAEEGQMERESTFVKALTAAERFTLEEESLIILSGDIELIFALPGEGPEETEGEEVNPLSVADLPRRYLDLESWGQTLHGQELLTLGFDGELHLLDLESGEFQQVTEDGRSKFNPVLSEQVIAWLVGEGERVVQIEGGEERLQLQSIVVYDRETGEERIISAEPAPRFGLVLDGTRLLWMDKRNEMEEHYTHYDIYAYDLESGREQAIVVAPGAQANPALHGDLVVWQDNRNSPHLGSPLAGCDNCPENRADLYLFDFAKGESRPLVEDGYLNANPTIYGQRVVWEKYTKQEGADLFTLELDSGEVVQLTDTKDPESRPQIDGERVMWHVGQACDVIQVNPDGQEISPDTGVYLRDLKEGTTLRLTDYIEPRAELDGDTVMILEGCMTGYEAYLISLSDGPAGG